MQLCHRKKVLPDFGSTSSELIRDRMTTESASPVGTYTRKSDSVRAEELRVLI